MPEDNTEDTGSKVDQILEKMEDRSADKAEEVAEKTAREIASETVQKFMESAPAVHTQSRTSPWLDYQPGEGTALRKWVECAVRGYQRTPGRNFSCDARTASSYTEGVEGVDEVFVKRFLTGEMDDVEGRAAPIAHGTDGGSNVLEQPLFDEILALLRAKLVLDELGVTVVPMTAQKLDIPRETSKGSFAYTNESATISESQYDFDQKQLSAKKLAGRVGVTNDFLRMNPRATSEWIADKMLQDFAVEMERAVIDGKTSGPEDFYKGIASGNKFTETSGSGGQSTDLAAYEQKLHDAVEAVATEADKKNVRLEDIRILCNVQHLNFLRRQRDSGQRIFTEVRNSMQLDMYPLTISNLIPHDKDDSGDTDGDETRIFVGDFSAYWLGILQDMRLDVSEHSRFADDEREFRLIGHHDGAVAGEDRLACLSTDISS